MIKYKYFLFKPGNPTIDNYDFLERFGTLHEFLIDLLNERIGIIKGTKEQNEMITKINELENFVLLEEENNNKEKSRGAIKKVKTKTQSRKIILSQRSVIRNAIKLYDKRDIIINAFVNKNIQPGDLEEDVYLKEKPECEESTAERKKGEDKIKKDVD